MTTNRKKYMSAFALSAAALFLGACDKGGGETDNPDQAVDAPADDGADAPADAAGDEVAANADEQVKCFGINGCKGESVCAVNKPDLGIEHSCAGENECSGKGWIKASRGDCESQDGEVLGAL